MIKGNRKYKYNKKEKSIVDRLVNFQKQQETNLLKSFWKGLRISKYTTQEEINERVLSFAKKPKNASFIKLADFQLKDMDFMSKLYETNAFTTRYFYPQEQMYKNHKYLLNFVKQSYKRKLMESKLAGLEKPNIESILYSIFPALEDSEFVTKVFDLFESENALEVLSNCYKGKANSLSSYEEMETQFSEMVEHLPMEFVANQVQKFGVKSLECLPEDYSEMLSMVVEAVEIDGFEAIGYLSAEEILANKFLLYRAYELFGVEKLLDFIRYDLSGYGTKYIQKDGKGYYFSFINEESFVLRNQILTDERIRNIILDEFKNAKTNKFKFTGFVSEGGEIELY